MIVLAAERISRLRMRLEGAELEPARRGPVLQLVPRRAGRAGEAHARSRRPPFAIEDRHDAAAVRGFDRARVLRVAANHLLTRPV